MSAIIPFDFQAPAQPGRKRDRSLNLDVLTHAAGFPSISIKGKVFTIVKGDERTPLMRDIDGDMVPVPSLSLAIVRANTKARVFYAKSYTEGDSENAKPTCFTHDGIAPDPASTQPQARGCQACPHAVWGSKVSADGQEAKGTACSVVTRLAVAVPSELTKDEPTLYLLRVPAGSRANFSEGVRTADKAGKDYNEIVMKIGFDPEAPSPRLTFRPVGLLDDAAFAKAQSLFDADNTIDICGRVTVRTAERVDAAPALAAPAPKPAMLTADDMHAAPAPAPAPRPAAPKLTADDLSDVGFTTDAIRVGTVTPAPKAPPKPRPAPAPAPAPVAAAPAPVDAKVASLLGDLASMLGSTDD